VETWLLRQCHPACKNAKWSPRCWHITLASVFSFPFCDPGFSLPSETKLQNRFLHVLIHRTSIPRYFVPEGINLQSFHFPIFATKTSKMGVNRYSKPKFLTLKLTYLQNYPAHSNQILQNMLKTKVLFVSGPNHAYNKLRWRTSAVLKNKIHFSATVQAIAMKFGRMTLRPNLQLDTWNFDFKKIRWRAAFI